jgi:hypothetical protein
MASPGAPGTPGAAASSPAIGFLGIGAQALQGGALQHVPSAALASLLAGYPWIPSLYQQLLPYWLMGQQLAAVPGGSPGLPATQVPAAPTAAAAAGASPLLSTQHPSAAPAPAITAAQVAAALAQAQVPAAAASAALQPPACALAPGGGLTPQRHPEQQRAGPGEGERQAAPSRRRQRCAASAPPGGRAGAGTAVAAAPCTVELLLDCLKVPTLCNMIAQPDALRCPTLLARDVASLAIALGQRCGVRPDDAAAASGTAGRGRRGRKKARHG